MFFVEIFAVLLGTILLYRLFGEKGLIAAVVMNSIVCNLQVIKFVYIFGIAATLGNAVYGATFLATDILSELYGKEKARKAVWLGFFGVALTTIYMQLALHFKPADFDEASPHLEFIFNLMPRIVIASLTAYLISQQHDVWAFHFWKEKTKGKYLWLRNNASTMVSQFIDTMIFCTIAFVGTVPTKEFWQIVLTTYIFKWAVAALDTPFIYWAVSMKNKIADLKEG